MGEVCFWCARESGVVQDWFIYPHHTDLVPDVQYNHVPCCLACRRLRAGRGIAGWLADCLEHGLNTEPRKVYEKLRDLDQEHPTKRTGVELRQLRRMLDMRYRPSVGRLDRLGKLFERSGRACIWCRRPLSIKHMESSVEHLVPKSKQGNDTPDNLLAACVDCNNRRRNKSPAEWIEHCLDKGYQPRIDLIWQSLSLLQEPSKGIRIRRRANDYQVELLGLLESRPGIGEQPFLPPKPWIIPPKPPPSSRRRRS